MESKAVGLVELSSVAAGFLVADTMLKTAQVDLLLNRTICSGKYMILIGGNVAAVRASVDAGLAAGGVSVIDSCTIPNIDLDVFPAISGNVVIQSFEALGVLEAFSVAALIEGADAAVKAANVQLIEIRLAMALGGKAFARLTGNVAAVQSAVDTGAATVEDPALMVGGAMMGRLTRDLDDCVTKTTGGLIVLPGDHALIHRLERPKAAQDRIGKSACDQCSYCTEMCPRYMLGYAIEPHKVMRSLVFSMAGSDFWSRWGMLCCECGLCTLYACPEDLYPLIAGCGGRAHAGFGVTECLFGRNYSGMKTFMFF